MHLRNSELYYSDSTQRAQSVVELLEVAQNSLGRDFKEANVMISTDEADKALLMCHVNDLQEEAQSMECGHMHGALITKEQPEGKSE